MTAKLEHPFYPIIYVRGYAGSQSEVEETVADPYMGFNLGSTKIRQVWSGDIERHYFESPLVRLMKDYGYLDVYDGGEEMPREFVPAPRSIVIYRYYDRASKDLGAGTRDEIEVYAAGLARLITDLKKRYDASGATTGLSFKLYLVAHSMGGLICRCFLQNDAILPAAELPALKSVRTAVDKVFTYATPHNGIDLRLVGNLPAFITNNNVNTFNRKRMRAFLSLPPAANDDDNVASLDGKFDPRRFFTLVGSNHRDYEVARGLASAAVGPMSDGLVRIENATVWGPFKGPSGKLAKFQSPRALVYRSHSGHYGIVNSEEGFQNLTRFLFGDLLVLGKLRFNSITFPPKVEEKRAAGKTVKASYHIENILRVRGKRFDLHRRLVSEESSTFRTFDELLNPPAGASPRHPVLFSTFLSASQRVNTKRSTLGFSIDLGVIVPEYEIDGLLFLDQHFEGGYLFRDKLNIEAIPPKSDGDPWRLRYGFDSNSPNQMTKLIAPVSAPDAKSPGKPTVFEIPIVQKSRPGIDAVFEISAFPWNANE